ncbi:MAG: DUF1015 domain-containing protein [Opitutales bacterium]|nr:DUF1015 domain-containing protein [Opitutales bacterium]
MDILPFRALRPSKENAPKVASLPYDVVSTEEAIELSDGNPISMLHIVRPEIDLPAGTDPHADEVYAKAVENFERFQRDGILQRDGEPGIYAYRQRMGNHVQTGVVALCKVEDYEANRIKKHEKTRQDKEDDRTRMTSDLSANAGPVFLTYKNKADIDLIVSEAVKGTPEFDFTAPDGIQHTGWRIGLVNELVEAFKDIDLFYVADGHHRSASASRVGKERKSANPNHTGKEDYNAFLCVIFPDNQLNVLAYNRLVTDLNGMTENSFLEALSKVGIVSENASDTPDNTGKVSIYLAGKWYGLEFTDTESDDPVERLDVSLLQNRVLAPMLGIEDPRISNRVQFAGGIRGTGYLKKEVDAGRAAVAFSMYPTTTQQLMDIADADRIMPPKSTWFEPKLRSGLFVHTFEK